MIRVGVGLLVVAGALVLSSCAAAPGVTSPPPSAPPSPTPTAEPAAEAPVPEELPAGVVGTGELVARDGSSLGTVTFSHETGSRFEVVVPEAALGLGSRPFPALTDAVVPVADCAGTTGYQATLGIEGDWLTSTLTEPSGDPSYWTHVILFDYATVDGCFLPVLATARLEWSISPTRPWIAAADHGSAPGATGKVLVRDGVPVAYRTARGDAWSAIAERFGLTPGDLGYLNPQRRGAGTTEAFTFQILNLDPGGRGSSAERVAGGALATSEDFR